MSDIADMVSRWFGEPVIVVENEIEALIQEQVRLARSNELRIVPTDNLISGYDFIAYRRKRLRELKAGDE